MRHLLFALLLIEVGCGDSSAEAPDASRDAAADAAVEAGPMDAGGDAGVRDAAVSEGGMDGGTDGGGAPVDGGRQPDGGRPSCDPVWTQIGLDGEIVRDLAIVNGTLWAATHSGLYRRGLGGGSFSRAGLDGLETRAFVALDDQTYLASTADQRLHRTEDGGDSWSEVTTDFGGDFTELIFDLELDPRDDETLYGTGTGVVARSLDGGESWTPIWGDWGSFAREMAVVEVSPLDGDIWSGGQNAIEGPVLVRSEDDGESWDERFDLVEAPSTGKAVTFHRTDPELVYLGFEAALLRTDDGGETFETVIDRHEDSRFFFGVEVDAWHPSYVYAGGWLKIIGEPQPLILFCSEDGGDTWVEREHTPEDRGGIVSMAQSREGGRTVLYAGLWEGGVYEIRLR